MKELIGTDDSARRSTEQAVTALSDQPIDGTRGTRAIRELTGLERAMTGVIDKLTNVDDRKSEVEKHLVREHKKLTELEDAGIQQEFRDRIRKLEGTLSDLELERQARLEALSANKEVPRSQVNRVRETFRRLLHEDTTLLERIRTLFREQGSTIVSILIEIGMAISTLVLALTGGGGTAPASALKGGLKEWVKKTLANLAGKAAAVLPGFIGSVVSWL